MFPDAPPKQRRPVDISALDSPSAVLLMLKECYLRIAHATERRRYWLEDAELWENEWDRRKAECIEHETRVGSIEAGREIPTTEKSAAYMWENSPQAKGIQAQGVWAHRKHNTYAQEIIAEEILVRMLEQRYEQLGASHGA